MSRRTGSTWTPGDGWSARLLRPEGLPGHLLVSAAAQYVTVNAGVLAMQGFRHTMWVCEERVGPTPSHLEPGRETMQRRGYWASAWETRSAHPNQTQKRLGLYSGVFGLSLEKFKHVLRNKLGAVLLHPVTCIGDKV